MDDGGRFAAIVLAGGRSTRLGRDKASELLLGRTMLQRVVDRVSPLVGEIVLVGAPGQTLPPVRAPLRLRTAVDVYPGTGPLGGIYTGLVAARADRCLAVACDMPLLSPALLRELLARSAACDVVMPVLEYPEPLHAVYARACVEPIRERLESGQLKITNFLGSVKVCYVREAEIRALDPDLRSFLNTNTEGELARAQELIEAETHVPQPPAPAPRRGDGELDRDISA